MIMCRCSGPCEGEMTATANFAGKSPSYFKGIATLEISIILLVYEIHEFM